MSRHSSRTSPSRRWVRVSLTVLLVGLVGLLAFVVPGWVSPPAAPDRSAQVVPAAGVPASFPASFPASDVLRGWDRRRAAAFAAGDERALRRLYVAGSSAGTSDEALLRAYTRRGLRVREMHMQLLSLEVLAQTPTRLRLRVTDRLARAVAVGEDGAREVLPRDEASTRVLVLRRTSQSAPWRMADVRE